MATSTMHAPLSNSLRRAVASAVMAPRCRAAINCMRHENGLEADAPPASPCREETSRVVPACTSQRLVAAHGAAVDVMTSTVGRRPPAVAVEERDAARAESPSSAPTASCSRRHASVLKPVPSTTTICAAPSRSACSAHQSRLHARASIDSRSAVAFFLRLPREPGELE